MSANDDSTAEDALGHGSPSEAAGGFQVDHRVTTEGRTVIRSGVTSRRPEVISTQASVEQFTQETVDNPSLEKLVGQDHPWA